jgi:peptidyl-prolyl cis-trans isomerase SurA
LKSRGIILAALAVCALATSCRKEEAPGPDVWATVNGKEILRSEVEKNYRARVNPEAPTPSHEEALSLEINILDELINSEILLDRANKLNLVASDAEVEDKFSESKNAYSEDEFEKKLKETGLTVDDMKSEIRRELSIEKLLNREIVAKITISDPEIADYYNKNLPQFDIKETQYHIAQIVVTPRPDATVYNRKNDKAANPAEAARKAAMLEARLASGADFGELAMDYSEDASASSGGDLGWIPQSGLDNGDPVLKNAVLALQPGSFSKVVPGRAGGYTILKLIAREPAGKRELSDPQVQEGIRSMLRSRKEQLLRAAYMTDARNDSHVTNYLARQIVESAGELPANK